MKIATGLRPGGIFAVRTIDVGIGLGYNEGKRTAVCIMQRKKAYE